MKTLSLDLRERMLLVRCGGRHAGGNRRAFRGFPGHGQETVKCNNAATPATSERGTTFPGASPKFWSGTGASSAVCWRSDRPYPRRTADCRRLVLLLPAIHYALAALNLTHKKTLRASEQDRRPEAGPGGLAAGMASGGGRFPGVSGRIGGQDQYDPAVGRARRGTRVHDSAPAGHWGTTTLIGSLRADGTTACMTIEEATDTEVFRAYVRQVLAPTLRTGDVVVMDNLSPGNHRYHRTGRGERSLSASLFARPQSDRKDVEQDQGNCAPPRPGADAVSIMPSPAL